MVAESDVETTTSVLALMGCFGVWLSCVVYLRVLQLLATRRTRKKRLEANPMGLPNREVPQGYSFDYEDPRNSVKDMPPAIRRAHSAVMNQAENFAFFAVAVIAHIALRGTKNGSSEVALLCVVHFAARALSAVAYILGVTLVRSAAFYVALLCTLGLYVLLLESLGIADDGPGGDDDDVGV